MKILLIIMIGVLVGVLMHTAYLYQAPVSGCQYYKTGIDKAQSTISLLNPNKPAIRELYMRALTLRNSYYEICSEPLEDFSIPTSLTI